MKIIIDVMGGDNAPHSNIKGAIDSLKENNINIILVGPKDIIEEELSTLDYQKDKVEIIDAKERIENDDEPTQAIRRKKDSSMVVGLNALADGLGDGFISAGNTGALLAGSILIIKRLEDIDRAAITVLYPTIKGMSLLIDAGANMDSKPEYLKQFAIMGYIYTKEVLGKNNPTVGLINVGSEKTKGNILCKETYKLLELENINFIGNIEGRDLPFGASDVMVCDGFVGNVVLKVTEGVAESLFSMLKKEFTSSTKSKLGALMLKNELNNLKKMLDYREYGGAPLLGVKKPVVKAHGSSDDYAVKNAISQLISYIDKDVIKTIESRLQ